MMWRIMQVNAGRGFIFETATNTSPNSCPGSRVNDLTRVAQKYGNQSSLSKK